ncbi:MAG: hypothetical protein ACM3VZ_14095 [Acidobacteriota bacterium]
MHHTSRIATLLALSCLLSAPVWAAAKAKTPAKAASVAESASAAASASTMGCGMLTPPECDKRQAEMQKIRDTKDPVERRKLMEQHRQEMHDSHMGRGGMGKGGMGMGMGASAPMMGASK